MTVTAQPYTLLETQLAFSLAAARLLDGIPSMGYLWKFGETLRTDEQAVINSYGGRGRAALAEYLKPAYTALASAIANNGKAKSPINTVHRYGLAIDILLFKDGKYLTETHEYEPLGEVWEGMHHLARWGGRFGDGNHFSFEYRGVR